MQLPGCRPGTSDCGLHAASVVLHGVATQDIPSPRQPRTVVYEEVVVVVTALADCSSFRTTPISARHAIKFNRDVVGPTRLMSEELIPFEFSGSLKSDEVRRVRLLAIPRVVYLILPFLVFDFSLDLWSLIQGYDVDALHLALSSMFLLILSATVLSVGPFCPRNLRFISGPVSGRVTAEGLDWRCGLRTFTRPWWGLVGWRRSGTVLLLLSSPTEPVFLTKQFMKNENDWQLLQKLVSARVNRSWVAALLW